MARKADVSIGTVSRVMNGETSVNPELSRHVFVEARRISFVPKTVSSHLSIITGRHNPAMPMGYTDVLTSLIERNASRKGFTVEVIDIDSLDKVYDCRISVVIGVVFSDKILQLKQIPNLPVIALNHPMIEHDIHSIYVDHYNQGVLAARHLVKKGHRKIALLQDLPDEWGALERRRGVEDVLKRVGLTLDPAFVRFSDNGPVYDILQRWIKNGVTAILNLSEDVVLEVLHIMSNVFNLRIGQDISTITLEDLPIYQYFTPPQTVIRQPLEEIARLAVDHAYRLSTNRAEKVKTLHTCLQGELEERDSVADIMN